MGIAVYSQEFRESAAKQVVEGGHQAVINADQIG
jgi:transposase-like protein